MQTIFRFLTSLARLAKVKNDEQLSGAQFLTFFWGLLLFSACLQSLEILHDNVFDLQMTLSQQFTEPALYLTILYVVLAVVWLMRMGKGIWLPLVSLVAVVFSAFWEFPLAANHFHLQTLLIIFCSVALIRTGGLKALPDKQNLKQELICWDAIYIARWFVIYLMIWTGLNKLLYGTYFEGQFLAFAIQNQPRFQDFYSWFLPQAELQQLLNSPEGPFRFQSKFAILLSNAVYISEILAGLLILIPKTRKAGAILTMAILLGIEVVAREWVFGSLMVQLILSFFPVFFMKRGFYVVITMYVVVSLYFILHLCGVIGNWGIT